MQKLARDRKARKTLPAVVRTVVGFDASSCPDIELRSTQMEAEPLNLSLRRPFFGHAACVIKSREIGVEIMTG